jgi:hypothetical protein
MSKFSPETRAKLAYLMAIRRERPELQGQINAGLRRAAAEGKFSGDRNVKRRPEVRAQMMGGKNVMADPATKAKHLAAVRAYHARRKAERGDG